ncbi:Ribonuclease [Melia azedarach]|uniref:Ribonuclease n=1 Tax=Melia azedarach TaxID=155640 RepID=A0ACC1YJQ8_MELAZ|nr:Ribonuclease [Melia azedarach]
MKSSFAICSFLFAITCLAASRHATGFEFIVFEWPGSYCSAKHGCCYPKTGKPDKDFTIGGFWPDDLLNSRPTYCNNKTIFRVSQIQDLRKRLDKNWPSLRCPSRNSQSLWRHEWLKYGTCSDYTQRQYFETALKIKENVDILKILQNAETSLETINSSKL